MTDPIAIALDVVQAVDVVTTILLAGRAVVRKASDGPDRGAAIAAADIEDERTYLMAAVGQLRVDVAELRDLTGQLVADRERLRVLLNLCAEHRREPMDDRREMLVDAGAAALVSPMTTREIARVERALRYLDPEDLELLRELRAAGLPPGFVERYEAHGDPGANRSIGPRRVPVLREGHLGGSNLLAAGCVAIVPHVTKPRRHEPLPTSVDPSARVWGGAELQVEEAVDLLQVGLLVLRFMRPGAVVEPPEDAPDDGAR